MAHLTHYILAGGTFLALFILFMVLSKTLNNILNHLLKLEYLLVKEYDLQKEVLTIKQMLADTAAPDQPDEEEPEGSDA